MQQIDRAIVEGRITRVIIAVAGLRAQNIVVEGLRHAVRAGFAKQESYRSRAGKCVRLVLVLRTT